MDKRTQELLDRTFWYGVNTAKFLSVIPDNHVINIYKRQLARSSSSIGANYEEAQAAESRRDFVHKVSICLKEARESTYWCRFILELTAGAEQKQKLDELTIEAQELKKIFSTIILSTKRTN